MNNRIRWFIFTRTLAVGFTQLIYICTVYPVLDDEDNLLYLEMYPDPQTRDPTQLTNKRFSQMFYNHQFEIWELRELGAGCHPDSFADRGFWIYANGTKFEPAVNSAGAQMQATVTQIFNTTRYFPMSRVRIVSKRGDTWRYDLINPQEMYVTIIRQCFSFILKL